MENKVSTEEQRIAKDAEDYVTYKVNYGVWLNEEDWDEIGQAYIAGATKEAERNKEDAIGFAEWHVKNDWEFYRHENVWEKVSDFGENQYKTSSELYDLFIEQNKKA